MKSVCSLLLLFTWSAFAQDGRLIENPIRKIPKWVRTEFLSQHLDRQYSVTYRLYPYFLHGDFNGDGRRDVAIQVAENSTGNAGIAIFHGRKPQALFTRVSILGAGKPTGKAGNDFKWANFWSLFKPPGTSDAGKTNPLPSFLGDALKIEKRGGTRGFIYWDGKQYVWFPQKQ